MIRGRLGLHTSVLAYAGRVLTLALGLILIWYGAMLVLLAAKLSPHTVNSLSGYRTIYTHAANLSASDFTTEVRLIAGFGGLIVFLALLYLALQELPRPYLRRGELALSREAHGRVSVSPRALERIGEIAAESHTQVSSVSGRLGDEALDMYLTVHRAVTAAETLCEVQERILADLARHELPALAVNVTLSGYDPKTRRELS